MFADSCRRAHWLLSTFESFESFPAGEHMMEDVFSLLIALHVVERGMPIIKLLKDHLSAAPGAGWRYSIG